MSAARVVLKIEQRTKKIIDRYDSATKAGFINGYDHATICRKCRLKYPKWSDKYIYRFEDELIKACPLLLMVKGENKI